MASECEELKRVLVDEYGEENVEEARRGLFRVHGWNFSALDGRHEAWPAGKMFCAIETKNPRDAIVAADAIRVSGVWAKEGL